ncbi:MAG: hypothetical protein WCE54_01745 [Ignavibacteriaceae bacterium]
MKKIFVSWLLLLMICTYCSAFSQIPEVISYQGILTDTTGAAKPDDQYNFTFRLYEAGSGGSAIWTESKKLIVRKGLFSTNLGDQSPFGYDIKFDNPYWLSIQIESGSEMPARIMLTPSAYSISSINSDTANYAKQFKIDNGQLVRSINGLKDMITLKGSGGTAVTTNGDTITIATSGGGNGGGISSIQNADSTLNITNPNGPSANINIKIPFKLTGSSDDYIVNANNYGHGYGLSGKSEGVGVYGESSNSFGVYGYSPKGVGVLGASNQNEGVYGGSNDSVGVVGQSTNSSGILARTYNQSRFALEALNSTANGIRAFCGLASNDYCIFAQNYNTATYGVLGANSNSITAGVFGYSNGQSIDEAGVYGLSTSSAAAILGYAPLGGYAGYFVGTVKILGDFINSNIKFEIDHPLDPSNKYLIHSAVESPEMKNIYDGVITTDADGFAVVDLPSYFQALNTDYRYQLTVIGQFAQAIIENKINNNGFTIKTDKPNVEVSWQVTGIRNDAYAKANPMVVEKEKTREEQGKYLMPELFGQPKEKGINYVNPVLSKNEKKN